MSTKQDKVAEDDASQTPPQSNLSRSDLENLRSLFEPRKMIDSEKQSKKKDHQDYPNDNYLMPIHPVPSLAVRNNDFQELNYQTSVHHPETFGSKRNQSPRPFTSFDDEIYEENQEIRKLSLSNEKQIYGTYEKRRDHHRRSERKHCRKQEYGNDTSNAEERLLRANFVSEQEPQQDHEMVQVKKHGAMELDDYQHQKQRHHVLPYHHRHNHYHPHKSQIPTHHHPTVSVSYQSKHPRGAPPNPAISYGDDATSISNVSSTSVYESRQQRHRHHSNSRLPINHHHGSMTPSRMSATSSNSSLVNHGSSPVMHYRAGDNANSSSTNSNSPAILIMDDQRSESPCQLAHANGNLGNSSNASYDFGSSNTNVRSCSRLDYIPEHIHHQHRVQYSHKGLRERLEQQPEIEDQPPPPPAPPSPSCMSRHINQHHAHNSNSNEGEQIKNSEFIGFSGIQVSPMPSKSKCQCHTLQENCRDKRDVECRSNGNSEVTSITHQPPALPPRPPPRTTRRYETVPTNHGHVVEGTCCKKYVILCSLCGGLSAAVGSLFLAVHAVLSAHTASLALFETVPSYIPGTMLIIMGFFTMLLARRKHRCGLLMKVCGSVGVVCALVCVLVTVTTTVVHMSRLQGLRECHYTARARSCTCYEGPQSKGDPGVLFEGTPHCEVVHGALYACLRALFGVSVAGILACIFSCMLVYQLLSHEKKKMYWEQLELRCRSLYGQGVGVTGVGGTVPGSCGCCNDCGGGTGTWWTQTQGNLYTPNPDLAPSRRWRLPWSRSRGPAASPDSNYGFHTQPRQIENNPDNTVGPYSVLSSQSGGPYSVLNTQANPYSSNPATYSILEAPVPLWGPPPPYSDPNSPARRPHTTDVRQQRVTKRIENYDNNEGVMNYHARVMNKRPSDNYENSEDLANSTDPEGGNEGTVKSRRIRKPLKGVENCAFQQEANSMPKQSESELYFGDVSSCCGPESSFYDVALDNEGERAENKDHLSSYLENRQQSKRSRQLPVRSDMPSNSYANNEDTRNTRISYLAPDAQYEVIQQGNYSYYGSKLDEEDNVLEDPKGRDNIDEVIVDKSKSDEGNSTKQDERDGRRKNYYQKEKSRERERKNNHHINEQCCLNSDSANNEWQNTEQTQSQSDDDSCCANNI